MVPSRAVYEDHHELFLSRRKEMRQKVFGSGIRREARRARGFVILLSLVRNKSEKLTKSGTSPFLITTPSFWVSEDKLLYWLKLR